MEDGTPSRALGAAFRANPRRDPAITRAASVVPTSASLNSWALKSHRPSVARLSHDQHAPPATSGAVMSPRTDAAIRVRTILITAPQQVHRICERGLTQSAPELERPAEAPARARSGVCGADAETRSCAHARNPSATHAATPARETAHRARSGVRSCLVTVPKSPPLDGSGLTRVPKCAAASRQPQMSTRRFSKAGETRQWPSRLSGTTVTVF